MIGIVRCIKVCKRMAVLQSPILIFSPTPVAAPTCWISMVTTYSIAATAEHMLLLT